MILCGLPHCGQAVVAPRCFHFTITALTVDECSSSRAKIVRKIVRIYWKSLSSSIRPFYCQCLCMEITWLCARCYTPVSNGCGWNSQIHSLEGVSIYFCIYSVSPWYERHFKTLFFMITISLLAVLPLINVLFYYIFYILYFIPTGVLKLQIKSLNDTRYGHLKQFQMLV